MNTCSGTRASASDWGDTHLGTFDRGHYDFQRVGEYVVAKSDLDDFEIQARQEPWRSSCRVTVNTAVAFHVAGHKVGVYLTNPGAQTFIDDQPASASGAPIDFSDGGSVRMNVAASQEAVEINRRQIELVPGDLPLLAAALSRYARQLGAVGRASDALAASQETLATYRRLTLADPARARAPLAEALVDCARLLRQARLEAEAFPLTREAVALYQQLGPATHPSYAAEAAHEMAVALARRQLWAEAVPLDEQAIGIYRRLGLAGGERFGALLGEATTAFIVHLAALGPDGEDYQRQLQQRDPVLCLQLDVLGQALASSPEILAEARARFGGRPR